MGSVMYRLSDDVIYAAERNRDDFAASAYEDVMRALKKLRQYENTGLTPGEVHSLLGELNSIGGYERLRQLAEADKAGRAVILPCKPGTTVYMTVCGEVWEMRVGQFHVNGYTDPRIWADIDCDWASTRRVRWDLAVGKTVFLTCEEAEKALEAMKDWEDMWAPMPEAPEKG